MATFSKQLLSGSTNGRQIKVAATATAGTLLHTAHATDKDEVHLFCVNSSGSAVKLTLEWGGVSSPDDLIEITIPAESGLQLIIPGLVVTGSVVIRAFAASANVLLISGWVNRITA
jgi:hypothetical protein